MGLVAMQAPRVKAPPLGLVPGSISHQGGHRGAEVELRPQESCGWAAGEESKGQSGRPGPDWGKVPLPVTVLAWAGLGHRLSLATLQGTNRASQCPSCSTQAPAPYVATLQPCGWGTV